jgi:hypothetical protein
MVNLAQAWAEEYALVNAGVSVEVSGGGTGTGVAALLNGTADIANCSRQLEPAESAQVKAATGQAPVEHIVGYDALAIFVHQDNPLDEITLAQLAAIYGETGNTRWWSDLNVKISGCRSNEMILISRQSNSGTYQYFRTQAALWDEVKDRLDTLGTKLSGGQQQRLTIARALSHEPEILCLDEFSIAIDPVTTMRIEEVLKTLRQQMTIILVTNLTQQARRLADRTMFLWQGELIELDRTDVIFSDQPARQQTFDYVNGIFG